MPAETVQRLRSNSEISTILVPYLEVLPCFVSVGSPITLPR